MKEERDKLYKEIGELKKQVEEVKAKIDELTRKIGELKAQRDSLVAELKRIQESERMKKEEEIKTMKKRIIEEKIKQGARLSFEDLKILYGEGSSEDGEGKDSSNVH